MQVYVAADDMADPRYPEQGRRIKRSVRD